MKKVQLFKTLKKRGAVLLMAFAMVVAAAKQPGKVPGTECSVCCADDEEEEQPYYGPTIPRR